MVELSELEIVLTRPFRVFLSKHLKVENQDLLKKYAFTIALLSCVCSGTVILFSLWTPYFTNELGFSQLQINIIGGLSSIGMYLLLPIIGNLADIYGTVLLSLLSIVSFTPSYYFAALAFTNHWGYLPMTICFALIGFGTSSLYFASLLTCANIYPGIKGLSISLPVTCYGLSSLLSSKLIQYVGWFHRTVAEEDGNLLILDIPKIFKFFSVMYLVIGFLSYTSSCILTIEKQVTFFTKQYGYSGDDSLPDENEGTSNEFNECENEQLQNNEQEPLLSNSITSYASAEVLRNDDLITEIDSINEISHQTKYKNFLKDYSAYLFLIAFFLCVGPLEMYINNMGSLVVLINKLNWKKYHSPVSDVSDKSLFWVNLLFEVQPNKLHLKSISISSQVSYHAFFSTAIRLIIGTMSDYLSSKSPKKLFFKNGLCRVWLLLLVLMIGVIDQALVVFVLRKYQGVQAATGDSQPEDITTLYGLVSSLAGIAYGGIFTIFPSIITSIWGVDIMGSTWGSFMVAPAFSSILFGVIYANIYDYFFDYRVYYLFIITGISIAASAALTFITWKFNWSKRGFSVF